MLQHNKLYQSLKKISAEWHAGHVQWSYTWNYLKFYEDGNVIYCGSPTDNVDEVNAWFNLSNEEAFFYKGKYNMNGETLIIDLTVSVGELKMDGCEKENYLILRSNNQVMGVNESWEKYTTTD